MKKPIVKFTRTKSKVATIQLALELKFDSEDAAASEKVYATLGRILSEVLQTQAQKEKFLVELESAFRKAVPK